MSGVTQTKRSVRSPYLRLSTLLPALSVGAVLLVAVWTKGGPLAVALGWKPQRGAPADHAGAVGAVPEQLGSGELPTQITLASPAMAKEMGIELAPIESRILERTIRCNGRAAFNQNHYAQVRPRVEGIMRRIRADVGTKVQAGDVLAVIDSAMLGDIKSAYLNSRTRLSQFEWEYQRLKKLTDQQAIPIKNFRDAESLFEQQQTTTANARQQLVNLGFTSAQLDQMVEDKDTTTALPVMAPWEGVVVSRHSVEGELEERNAPLFAIADLRTLWIYLNLYESDIGQVHLGQAVTFVADGLPDVRFEGPIDWISPEVDPRTRITQVRAEVANTDGAMRANMFGKGRIVTQTSRDSLVVPELAVQIYRGQPVVFVREADDRFAVRPVTIGIKGENYWELLSGAERGEQVATTGSFLLKSELEKEKLGPAE